MFSVVNYNPVIDKGDVVERLPDAYVVEDPTPCYISGRRVAWKDQLANVIADFYGCILLVYRDHYIRSQVKSRYHFVGLKANIVLAKFMYSELLETIPNQFKQFSWSAKTNSYSGFVDGLRKGLEHKYPNIFENAKKQKEAAERFLRLTHFSVNYLDPCSPDNVNMESYAIGKLMGEEFIRDSKFDQLLMPKK